MALYFLRRYSLGRKHMRIPASQSLEPKMNLVNQICVGRPSRTDGRAETEPWMASCRRSERYQKVVHLMNQGSFDVAGIAYCFLPIYFKK